ncbi:MAG TPA: hypothetical protein PLU24_03380, partial [Candidatus Omnitrophota bacterium]|nr:hypothetical protein [Candidatus Omnitrophota bacterium]
FWIFLSLGLLVAGFYASRLRIENEKLIGSLSENIGHQRLLKEGSKDLQNQIEEMKFLSSQSVRKAEMLQRRLDLISDEDKRTSVVMEGSINFLKKYKEKIDKDTQDLINKKTKVDEDAANKEKEAGEIGNKVSEKFYLWLSAHQNNSTGLLTSFEGDKDIGDWGFTYDESLASIVFVKEGDFQKARDIFNFYLRAKRDSSGAFYNAYYTNDGEPAEFTVHAGPNIWLGIAILQYSHATKDMSYVGIAKDIAKWLESITDEEGGIRGGREFGWYSIEHNFDAYAFYMMLSELLKNEEYGLRAQNSLSWLNKNAYSKISEPVVRRGKGDSTIATDTFAWSITSITPKTLIDAGMDPDAIADFALANSSVISDFRRPDGSIIKVKGFDFSKHQNLARGGVVSTEWTAQMILALKIMAAFHASQGDEEKAVYYYSLANEYTSELSKMVVTSPSPVGQGDFCLPYASHEFADTGHGWRTPKGNRTGSVAGTAYAILAIDGFNPLRFNK